MKNYQEQNDEFITSLQRLCQDRGHAASLRRHWSPATRHQAFPVLGRLGAIGRLPQSTVAALFAVHPQHAAGTGIGRAALRMGERKDGEHPYDRHFRRLLACDDLDDLAPQLYRLVKRLERDGIGIDYALLLRDLRLWAAGHAEMIKTDWAKDFWQAPNPETAAL